MSKPLKDYTHMVKQAIAGQQLKNAGADIHADQAVRYLITNADHKNPQLKVKAAELTTNRTWYDVNKYLELLFSAAGNILRPFGYTAQKLRSQALDQEQQQTLNQERTQMSSYRAYLAGKNYKREYSYRPEGVQGAIRSIGEWFFFGRTTVRH